MIDARTLNVTLLLNYTFTDASVDPAQIVTDSYKQLDATANWNLTDDIWVYLAAVNITNEIIFQGPGTVRLFQATQSPAPSAR